MQTIKTVTEGAKLKQDTREDRMITKHRDKKPKVTEKNTLEGGITRSTQKLNNNIIRKLKQKTSYILKLDIIQTKTDNTSVIKGTNGYLKIQ